MYMRDWTIGDFIVIGNGFEFDADGAMCASYAGGDGERRVLVAGGYGLNKRLDRFIASW